jgi:PAS domain S-box-containing protein
MYEFFAQIFSADGFPPRWQCGNWSSFHGWLYVASDLGVWSAYTAIPAVLVYFVWRKTTIPFKGLFLLFGAFILACGLTHLLDAIMFWWPAYRLLGLVEFLTAAVSWATVVALVPIVPRALSMRSPEELEREVEARRKAEIELQRVNQDLERRIQERTAELTAANASLQQEREWFKTTLASIGDAVIATNRDGRVVLLNSVAQALTGWNEAEAAGKPLPEVFQIIDQNTQEAANNPAELALAEDSVVAIADRTVLVSKSGERRLINDSAAPIRDTHGQITGVVLVFRDVSEQKRGEGTSRLLADVSAALVGSLHNQSVLREIAELTVPFLGDLCFFDVLTPDDEIERVGWKHVDKEKSNLSEDVRRFAPPKSAEKHPIPTVLRTGEPVLISEVTDDWLQSIAVSPEHLSFLRGLQMCSLMTVPMRIGEKSLGTMTFANSVSNRRYRSDILALAEEIARRTALAVENANLFAQLREADRKKDEFLALLAHELRNPLAPMRNAVEFLRLQGPSDPALEEAREMIERQIAHMVRLVDDLLDVSRITRGKVELHMERLDLARIIQTAIETSRPLVEASKQELFVDLPDKPITIDGDLTRLAQVISNLLNNSAKYTSEGGRIWLTVRPQGEHAEIRVRDNGMGIPVKMLPQVFEMFTQVDRTLRRSHGGLGIGLTVVRRLVEMHGGTVVARSEGLDKGSEFIVRLPLAKESPSQSGQPADSDPVKQTLSARRILVVDDNSDSAQSLAMVLRVTGNEVRLAQDGPSALQVAKEFRPELVLLDIGLPGMDGYEVARRMRQMPEMKGSVLVAQTGWGQEEDRRRSRDAGFHDHLVKPLDPAALQSLLERLSRDCKS